ncbi:MAG: alanine racemase [Pseudomonadota bacterium]
MGTGRLSIDWDALAANWRALDRASDRNVNTAAVVKAGGYGLGAGAVAKRLAEEGVRHFFVAIAEEGAEVRTAVGPGPAIYVFSGHMAGDTRLLHEQSLVPLLNAPEQVKRHLSALPEGAFGVQLDTGMNRLGVEANDWAGVRGSLSTPPVLLISHLACGDAPDDPMNRRQLANFRAMTADMDAPKSLAATGGILLGRDYHFDLTRPGIGLYGGFPFADAATVVRLSLPVIQVRELEAGETVGYGNSWTAERPTRIATLSAGYADGLIRAMGGHAILYFGDIPCPLAGRVSMDLLTVDVTHLDELPEALDVLSEHQSIDDLAAAAGTIGHEILTSIGTRYARGAA